MKTSEEKLVTSIHETKSGTLEIVKTEFALPFIHKTSRKSFMYGYEISFKINLMQCDWNLANEDLENFKLGFEEFYDSWKEKRLHNPAF